MKNNDSTAWETRKTLTRNSRMGHAYWAHEKVKSSTSVTGYYYIRDCACSNCGQYSRAELATCPNCGCVMDAERPKTV